jgi:plastocyanin
MKKAVALLALMLAAVALVACGGSSSSSSSESTAPETTSGQESEKSEGGGGSGGTSAVQIEADPNGALAYTTESATAKAGKVTVDFANSSPVPHDVAIEDEAGETIGQTELISEGEDSTEVELKPGTYHFYCTVPGHREAGMEGTLTVK